MDVAEAIRTKRAVRQFAGKTIPEEALHSILNAGRRAASSKNSQPWQFILIRERETLRALSKMGTYAGHVAEAAAAVAILTPDPAQRWSIMFDAGQAAANMQLAAWELGVGSCPVTIYEPEKARTLLGFPRELHLRAMLALGYPADDSDLSRPPQSGGRQPLQQSLSYERWGKR